MDLSISIDIGGTAIKANLISREGKILEEASCPTPYENGAEIIFQSLCNICNRFLTTSLGSQIKVIGIGTPGKVSFEKQCVVDGAYQLKGWKNFPFVQKLSKHTHLPVFTDNDANLMSYGEFLLGSAKGYKNAICITLGTGIGGGIILNQTLHRGSFEYAGEVGHMIIEPNGRLCLCGCRGCWEAYASATGLINEAKEHDFLPKKKWTANDIFTHAKKGDPLASKILKTYVRYLGLGMTNLIRIFDPEVFVIGGGIAHSKDIFFKFLLCEMKNLQRNNETASCRIKFATLGNKAGVIGANAFAFDSLKRSISRGKH